MIKKKTGKQMRIVVNALLGRWDFHQPQQIDGARTRLFSIQSAVADESLCNLFFFSRRRRHTRLTCDWSSDVCSSDLLDLGAGPEADSQGQHGEGGRHPGW